MTFDQFQAGLVGALISAVFSFFIRSYLDSRNSVKVREHAAYVHLIQINDLLAMFGSITSVLKEKLEEKKLVPRGGPVKFDFSFMITAIIASEVTDLGGPEVHQATARKLLGVISSLTEALADAKLSSDDLAKLPIDAISPYHDFVGQIGAIRGILHQTAAALERETPSLPLSAVNMQTSWRLIQRAATSANKLYAALAKASGQSKTNIESLSLSRRAEYDAAIRQAFTDFDMLQTLEKAITKAKTDLANSERT